MQDVPLSRIKELDLFSVPATDLLAIALSTEEHLIREHEQIALNWLLNNSIYEVSHLNQQDLIKMGNLNSYDAIRILAAIELGRRSATALKGQIQQIDSAKDVYKLLNHLRKEKKEHFVAILLDVHKRIIATKTIHIGTNNASLVGPKEIFREAIKHGAEGVIIAHNHPSGDPTPSMEDIDITTTLVEVGDMIDLCVLDHVIIGSNSFISMKKEGYF